MAGSTFHRSNYYLSDFYSSDYYGPRDGAVPIVTFRFYGNGEKWSDTADAQEFYGNGEVWSEVISPFSQVFYGNGEAWFNI